MKNGETELILNDRINQKNVYAKSIISKKKFFIRMFNVHLKQSRISLGRANASWCIEFNITQTIVRIIKHQSEA